MAILHGSWLLQDHGNCLFLWGETWRPVAKNALKSSSSDALQYPLAMKPPELLDWFRSPPISIAKSIKETANSSTVEIPDSAIESIQYLQPWQVEGFCLSPLQAVKFLTSLPLNITKGENAFLGGDLSFWSQVARWSLDLISRCKFLPTLKQQEDHSIVAQWQALLDSALDGTRLEKFSQLMPLACRMYQSAESSASFPYVDLPQEPQQLLQEFLNSTIDAQVKAMVGSQAPVETRAIASLPSPIQQWLHSLTPASVENHNKVASADTFEVERLEAVLKSWTMPLQHQLAGKSLFRTCFQLLPPETGKTDWTLAYFLQAADEPEFVVDAATIWNHPVENWVYQNRTINDPQETFLRGLGIASRLYPPIAPSLDTGYPEKTTLNPLQAYEFIKTVALRFEDSGLGVVLPTTLTNREGWANRLGLKITAQTSPKKEERLSLQSLLNFQWQLAIGGQTLSKKEFDRLVALKSPLVEINGEWVELRPQDIKTAQAFFASRKEQMSLSLEDALRLSKGDTQTIEKLPVVTFEASGTLQELINTLSNNQAIAPLPAPQNFRGQLRPYQERGLAWLAFLERWGLGACLADDMGLGKCVAKDTLIAVNGKLSSAEEIWQTYAGDTTKFDGEGFWAEPTEELVVNSIDEQTSKIVQAPVRHLYRQLVREKLRKVTLQDGSSITITRRHKLLTNKGWTNDLKVGDYVCVPAKMLSFGKPEEPDLGKFLAWQIAERHEIANSGTV